ncbi:hypothetical protein EF847_21635 [Actinobacteria bacterium YIM 96077]|uniref:Glycosyltransferase RgtA/B/C/D-like domain-containing protein n=1 Tax=Phytoactinopolyspora halophila TaxID=1981511 RepID=A0A329QTJ8_9ACTN|nr:glycosyltransferase family 39 protein [Phytoactinopolyspora halophila]AYY14898.1 hypothetical protein EF847_21635 [Actinobacteria bacterium YIM 96077]RAW15356.1 hypothetical protein DPM12_08865 [Phytoactinopolyspora halophila]
MTGTRVAGEASSGRGLSRHLGTWLRDEIVIIAILVGSFLARWLLSGWNSYWLDELYSVAVYGRWNDGAIEAVRNLAENSVHPPLYQFTLFHWMNWFGDSEAATRTLSNLYVTLATLCLYALLRHAFARRVALASAAIFALMYLPFYYALETRSYAQTVFLVTLSSYLLSRMLRSGASSGWRVTLLSPPAILFTVTNAALLLTHYYTVFFWVAQAAFVGVFVLREWPVRRWLPGLGTAIGMYLLQGAIFAVVWGRVLIDDVDRRADAYPVEGRVLSPGELLLDSVVYPNIDPPRLVAWAGLVAAILLLARSLVELARGRGLSVDRQRAWSVAYLVAWLVLPMVAVYIVFSTLGVERYNMRYFLFCVVPLAPLVVLTVEEAVRQVGRAWRRVRGSELPAATPAVVTVVVIATLILPGTYRAATATKDDWRGSVQRVVDVVHADEDSRYIVLEASHRDMSLATFYFEKFSDSVRVHEPLSIDEEREGELRTLARVEPVIAEHDYLILLFPHLGTADFPDTLEWLGERYDLHHPQLDSRGRGFIVFAVDQQ